jgi:hypothetical protein
MKWSHKAFTLMKNWSDEVLTFQRLALLLHSFIATALHESKNYWVLDLSDSKPMCFWTYLILNLSDIEPIWFGTVWFRTYLIRNSSDIEPNRYQIWGLFGAYPSVLPLCPPLPYIQGWSTTPHTAPLGKISDKIGQPQSSPLLQLEMIANPS